MVLIARAQPALEPGAVLELDDGRGTALPLVVGEDVALPAFAEGLGPAAVLSLLLFVASKATGILRHSEDSGLAASLHALAETAMAPERTAIPAAQCGTDMIMWALPPAAAAPSGVHYAVGRHRLRRVAVRGGIVLLRDRQFEDGYLLSPESDGPIHLAPAGGPLPPLSELGRRKDLHSLTLYRSGLAELGRRAPGDEDARRLLRDLQLLAPIHKPRQINQPGRPLGAALEMALCDHGGGAFFRGWLRDPFALLAGLTLLSDHGAEVPLPLDGLGRFARPDLAEGFAGSPFGDAGLKPGFVAHLPDASQRPVSQWSLRLELTTGDSMLVMAPPAIIHPQAARDAVLSAIPPAEITAPMMAESIAPAVARLHRAVLAQRRAPEVLHIGGDAAPAGSPAVSIVVPLYRNLRFLKHQYAAFARDPSVRDAAELIYVLDSPEQRAEVEHLLRGLQGLYRLPVTLVVQSGNFGYASACNAGAEVAQAPLLLMLNSDVVPAARGWLAPLRRAMADQPEAAALGPKLLFEDGSLQHAGLYFERGPGGDWFNAHYYKGFPRRFPAAQRARRVPAVTGAALLVRSAAYAAVGGFSTDYVIGDYEDSDLCLRLRAAGWEIAYVPEAELYHFERQSIRDHMGYARTLASTYNRRMHHLLWAPMIEDLMAEAGPPGRRRPPADLPAPPLAAQ